MAERPHAAYAVIAAAFAALFALVAGRLRRDPEMLTETPPARDVFLLGLASFQLSRVITYDKVTSTFRLPFVEEGKGPQHPEGTQEQAKGSGLQLAIGQLLTCSPCMSAWTGALLAYLYVLSPRLGRLVLLVLSASGMSQLIHPTFELLMKSGGLIEASQKAAERQAEDGNK